MGRRHVFVLFLLGYVLGALASDVEELTHTTFDSAASGNSGLLIKFYANWCGHCRSFAPAFAEVARRIDDEGLQVRATQVDADTSRVLLQRFGVRALPSVYYVSASAEGRRVYKYIGPLSTDDVMKFARSGGEKRGEVLSQMLGPFHPYWRVISALVVRAEAAHQWMMSDTRNVGVAIAAAAGCTLGALVLFTLFVHVLTKPPSTSRPRPHAE